MALIYLFTGHAERLIMAIIIDMRHCRARRCHANACQMRREAVGGHNDAAMAAACEFCCERTHLERERRGAHSGVDNIIDTWPMKPELRRRLDDDEAARCCAFKRAR